MSVERHRLSERLFHEALKRLPEERERYLFEACRKDWNLYREVLSLLRYHEEPLAAIHTSLFPTADTSPFLGSLPKPGHDTLVSDRARYRILEVLGEGGMGIVYLADQTHPLRRRVALKVIKIGLDSRKTTARFESERQALAIMDHPGIAQVYEAGAASDGRLYFAMEYVPGRAITEYCDDARLSLTERLKLFIEVCNAVHHAHQKGIIHRDLKPSNILVGREADSHAPKIIDFGVAKAMNQRLVEQTFFTHYGTLIGSLEYMSPEQARCRVLDVDTRSDIYSLGVVLYELLVGMLPIDVRSTQSEGYAEVERRILEEEPKLASRRWIELGEEAHALARKRATDPETLLHQVRGDLDWILTKTLEKERLRRYASVSELAADVQRFLDREPVLAGPPSRRYKLGKLVERNRPLVAGLAVAGLALALGFVTSTWLFVENRNAMKLAQAQRDDLLTLSDVKRVEACVEEAERLYPPHPEKIEAMEAWLNGPAKALAARLPYHKRKLLELEEETKWRGTLSGGPRTGSRPLVFSGADLQFQYDLLSELVQDLEELIDPDPRTGLIANVKDRFAFAKSVYHETIEAYQEEWAATIASIADRDACPAYNGLVIEPQLGLIPLGPDPKSGLWEFAHLRTGRPALRGADGHLVIEEETGIVLVLMPGGRFRMGAVAETEGSHPLAKEIAKMVRDDELPVHEVYLGPFFLSKYEMTQAQWLAVTGKNPSDIGPTSEFHHSPVQPVENVNRIMVDRVMRIVGLELPTEAQWEYAARAGTVSPWWCGWDKMLLATTANLYDQSARGTWRATRPLRKGWDDGFAATAPVGSFEANPFGIHDVTGNVWEWCRDFYGSYELPTAPGDGLRMVEDSEEYVCRGGGYAAEATRVARRVNLLPVFKDRIGVRPARQIDLGPPSRSILP